MKKLIIAAVLMIGITSFAQEKPFGEKGPKMERLSPEERNAKHLQKLTSELNLSASQQTEVGKILSEQSAKKYFKKNLSQTEIDQLKNEKKNDLKESEAKIKTVLTPEQLKKYDELKTQKKEEMIKKREERKEAKEKN